MLQRRRLASSRSKPITAAVLSVALVASAAVGVSTKNIMETQGVGTAPAAAVVQEDSLASGKNVVVSDAAIATQGDGPTERTVKEFTREKEFSQFALTWKGKKDIAVFVRAKRADGSWSKWYDAEPISMDVKDPNQTRGTELIYVEPTRTIQVSTSGVDLVGNESAVKADDFDVVMIDGGTAPTASNGIALNSNTYGMPNVITRAQWGADESKRCRQPSYQSPTTALTVHHTAGSNNYTEAQAKGQVNGIYIYHAQTLGWCDIGYHALADKYGNLYEGRYGGLTRDQIGAHAGGFNQNTWAVSMIGNYDDAPTTQPMIQSVGELLGWRAAVSGFDPTGTSTHYSEGSDYTFVPRGQAKTLPNIFAHKDVGNTACPGRYGYAQMPTIRSIAKQRYDQIQLYKAQNPGMFETPTTPEGTQTGTDPNTEATTQALTMLLGLSSEKDEDSSGDKSSGSSDTGTVLGILAGVGSLLAIGIALAAANGALPGGVSNVGDVQVVDGLTLAQVIPMVQAVTALSSDPEMVQGLNQLVTAVGPVLGENKTGVAQYTNKNGELVKYAMFENGILLNADSVGTRALWGVIGNAWASQGFDAGPLGLPVTEEFKVGPLIRVEFQGGFITFNPITGDLDIQVT